jgi:hypothetical protein
MGVGAFESILLEIARQGQMGNVRARTRRIRGAGGVVQELEGCRGVGERGLLLCQRLTHTGPPGKTTHTLHKHTAR